MNNDNARINENINTDDQIKLNVKFITMSDFNIVVSKNLKISEIKKQIQNEQMLASNNFLLYCKKPGSSKGDDDNKILLNDDEYFEHATKNLLLVPKGLPCSKEDYNKCLFC